MKEHPATMDVKFSFNGFPFLHVCETGIWNIIKVKVDKKFAYIKQSFMISVKINDDQLHVVIQSC